MAEIFVKDFLSNTLAVSASDGDKVFEEISNRLSQGERVILNFSGIDLVITAFLNTAIGKLYSKFSSDDLKTSLDIKGLDQEEIMLLKLVIDRAKERFS